MNKQKRALAVHDISCVGRCSLTVALPIISAAGVDTSILPTAVLSTHTGGFTGYTYRDLTEDILPIADHWESLGGFAPEFPLEMKTLCAEADIIVPNITEAALMLEEPYQEGPYTREYIEGLLRRLGEIGARQVVLTGVYFDEKRLGAASLDTASGEIRYAFQDTVDGYFHGTGDVFGSALLAALLNDKPLEEAMGIAVDYTQRCIVLTAEASQEARYGVCFERALPYLMERLGIR